METKANYAAVGIFVFSLMLATVIALLWLAGTQYSEEYKYYETYFSGSVSGLSKGTKVRYNGIEVGRVDKLRFDPEDPKRVIVTVQIDPALPLHEDSIASIASEGITGGSYVEIEGGSKKKPLLTVPKGHDYPVIKSRPSTLQQLAESAPVLIAKFNKVGDQMNDLLKPANRAAFSAILANLETTTNVLAKRSNEIDVTITNLGLASEALNRNLSTLDTVLRHTDQVARHADEVLSGDTVVQIDQLVTETRTLVTSLKRLSNELDRQPTKLLFGDRRQGYTPQ
ncbi:MAG: MCE family protein [Alphaproteobacteria bacterium]|nr:MCE family protein [Alphaproteobacteria bacterium]